MIACAAVTIICFKEIENVSQKLAGKSRAQQLTLELAVLKFDVPDTEILREINFGHFVAPKTTILTIFAALNF